jgi:cerevisin
MRTTFTFTAVLASWIAATAATKGEGFIGQTSKSATNASSEVKVYNLLYNLTNAPNSEGDLEKKRIQTLIDQIEDFNEDAILAEWENPKFGGASVQVRGDIAEALNSMAEVALIEETVAIKTFAQKTGAPWGLQRISSDAGASGNARSQDFVYTFDDENLGAGVDVYIVDTGVRTSHAVFGDGNGGSRAIEGFSFTGSVADGDGHGTHCAGTATGLKFGVAQNANIIAVKVLGDDGSGSSSDTISGMDWIINRHETRKTDADFKGSVMSMSWGLQGTADAVDQVILSAIDAGIHISVAAGNDAADACQSTPSHNGGANSAVVSVGAVNIDNTVSTFSNIGTCVDVYAPGEQVLSSWATGDNVINFLSGTSMACPHVSGVMAYLLAQDDSLKLDPAGLKAKLLATARENAFTGNIGGSDNLLLSNGANGNASARRLMKNWVVPDNGATSGSPAAKARSLVQNMSVNKRWELHSEAAELRF